MKWPCSEVGIARECEKFSDKGTVDEEGHGMGGLSNYCLELSDLMV